jgi:hypothetical protein
MENRRRESLTVLRKLAVEPSTRRNRLQTAGHGNTLFLPWKRNGASGCELAGSHGLRRHDAALAARLTG